MTDHKFTPGPWLREGRLIYALSEIHEKGHGPYSVNRFSAQVGWGRLPDDSVTPDAELVATATLMRAAPELLAACEAALYFHEEQQRDYGGLDPDLATQIERVKDALAKALGKPK
jgi:hypothetical protein